jgi:hypothetical protein
MLPFGNCCLDPIANDSCLNRLQLHGDPADAPPRAGSNGIGLPASTRPDHSFWSDPLGIRDLIALQGVKPARRIEDLKADFWPDDEGVDEFIAAVRRWRGKSE